MPKSLKPCCGNCYFANLITDIDFKKRCRRYPPIWVTRLGGYVHPTAYDDNICGEYIPMSDFRITIEREGINDV